MYISSNTPLSVVHVAEAAGGGLMAMLQGVCLGHIQAGYRVTVVHGRRPETSEAMLDLLRAAGVRVVEVAGWGERTVLSELKAMRELHRAVESASPDIVVLHSSFAGVVGMTLARSFRTVFAPHAFASQITANSRRDRIYTVAENLTCRVHSSTACVSVSESRVARRRGSRDARVILNGCAALDAPDWPENPQPPSVPTVVGSGRLVHQRRPIETAAMLKTIKPHARVRWLGGAGDGPYAERSGRALEDAGVDVTGWLPNAEVRSALRDATVYLHWTSWDGLPITVLEAMAEDAVVVAADNEPNWEVLGRRGVFRTEHGAVTEIRRLLADSGYWSERVLEQRERARRFAESRMQREWNELVQELASRQSSTQPASVPAMAHAG